MNLTDSFLREYKLALADGVDVASPALHEACCNLVAQLKRDGFLPEQMIAYVKKQMSEAGGGRVETTSLDHDVTSRCIKHFYQPPEKAATL